MFYSRLKTNSTYIAEIFSIFYLFIIFHNESQVDMIKSSKACKCKHSISTDNDSRMIRENFSTS